jgi:hypothetical protein
MTEFESYIHKIHELMHSAITTPYNLLENARLPNYDYVKYYTENDFLIAEMSCKMDEISTLFFYYFDSENKLSKIVMEQNSIKEIKFDREFEVKMKIDEYKKVLKHQSSTVVS